MYCYEIYKWKRYKESIIDRIDNENNNKMNNINTINF